MEREPVWCEGLQADPVTADRTRPGDLFVEAGALYEAARLAALWLGQHRGRQDAT